MSLAIQEVPRRGVARGESLATSIFASETVVYPIIGSLRTPVPNRHEGN
ncbi:hypothetical protein RRSWK_04852 [Rhodopirellula sp. SWK7]|nr:hypothetical protein RRSWK_04852 [Rhodopirellula sp. SWK7]